MYEHVTPETKKRILDILQARSEVSLLALRTQEEELLTVLLPQMAETINQLKAVQRCHTPPSGRKNNPMRPPNRRS